MNTIAAFLQADWAERAGWTLLHSLWQLTAVAAVYAIVAFVLRKRSADARYALGCVAIVAMVGLPVGTYAWLPHVAPWGIEEAFHAPAAVTLRTESPGALPAESPGLLPRELPDLLPSEVRDPPGELTRLPVGMGERVAAPVECRATRANRLLVRNASLHALGNRRLVGRSPVFFASAVLRMVSPASASAARSFAAVRSITTNGASGERASRRGSGR